MAYEMQDSSVLLRVCVGQLQNKKDDIHSYRGGQPIHLSKRGQVHQQFRVQRINEMMQRGFQRHPRCGVLRFEVLQSGAVQGH